MFDNLSERLGGILDRLTGRGALSEKDVDAAMREVRRALLEADVALEVVRSFTDRVREQAIGATVVKSVTPGQMVVKIVHDELVATLGSDGQTIDINAVPPVPIMMVGLQGSGKTTTTAKLARRMTQRDKRKVLMASLDIYRPAAMEQLAVLGRDLDIPTLPIVAGQKPAQIAKRALEAGRLGGYDVVLLDTAGRTTLDEEMMSEAAEIKTVANPHEVLLVADSLTGQDAVNLARAFDQRVGLTGIVLTRVDGDGRGGAALSMRAVTGKPIKLIGTGEKTDALEDFHPSRIAGRILGMGDVVSLVEKAAANIDAEKAARTAERMRKGLFDLTDMQTFTYTVKVQSIKQKSLPELDDQFATQLGEFKTLDEVRQRIREGMESERKHTAEHEAKDKLVAELVKRTEFEVPEALVDRQIDVRLERGLRALAAQGMKAEDIKKMDLNRLRVGQREQALQEVKASLVLDKIAEEEKIEVSDEEIDREIDALATQSKQTPEAIRARLTRDGALDRIRNRIRSEKTLDFLYRQSA